MAKYDPYLGKMIGDTDMITKNLIIDGEVNGIVVKTKAAANRKSRFITLQDKVTPRLFNNLQVAKVTAGIIIPGRKFEYFIKIGNNNLVNIDYCNNINDTWQFVVNDTLYIVKEKHSRRTMHLGYICFENGEIERCDRQYGTKRQKELMNIIRDELTALVCENIDGGISSIEKDGKEYIINLKNTSAKIHIMYGSKLMDLNQTKRSAGKRCLPFIKDMDKYLTFYLYSDKDRTESAKLEASDKATKIIEYIIDDLQNIYTDLNVKYIPVDYNGYIGLED